MSVQIPANPQPLEGSLPVSVSVPCPAPLLTPEAACDLAGGISLSTLNRLVKKGDLRGRVKLGRSVRYEQSTFWRSVVELVTS